MFNYLDLDLQSDQTSQKDNITQLLEAIEDYFTQLNYSWTDAATYEPLELALRQTIGIALKCKKGAEYIEQLMTLESEAQEHLGALVKTSLSAIEDMNSCVSSNRSG